jgi:hypothetical protein
VQVEPFEVAVELDQGAMVLVEAVVVFEGGYLLPNQEGVYNRH